jgi:hypothetical protein
VNRDESAKNSLSSLCNVVFEPINQVFGSKINQGFSPRRILIQNLENILTLIVFMMGHEHSSYMEDVFTNPTTTATPE